MLVNIFNPVAGHNMAVRISWDPYLWILWCPLENNNPSLNLQVSSSFYQIVMIKTIEKSVVFFKKQPSTTLSPMLLEACIHATVSYTLLQSKWSIFQQRTYKGGSLLGFYDENAVTDLPGTCEAMTFIYFFTWMWMRLSWKFTL